MLSGQPRGLLVELIEVAAGGEVRFEKRDLAIFIDVGPRIRNRRRDELPEASEVMLIAAFRGGDNDAIVFGESVEEWGTRGRAIDHRQRTRYRLEPRGQFFGSNVLAPQVELCGLSVVGAM